MGVLASDYHLTTRGMTMTEYLNYRNTIDRLESTYDLTGIPVFQPEDGKVGTRINPPLLMTGFELAALIKRANEEARKFTTMAETLGAMLNQGPQNPRAPTFREAFGFVEYGKDNI